MIPLSRPIIGDEEIAAVQRVMQSGQLAHGPEVEEFEREFCGLVNSRHAVAIANGTVALALGLQAIDIKAGDEVIVPAFTFIATANAVRLAGARPVFADIDPTTFCVTRRTVEPLVTARTAAVIAVHLFGHAAPMSELLELCESQDLALIEDAAQAVGTQWRGEPVGALGIFGTFSFYPTKNITTGEGGMVTTNRADVAERIALLRNHGARTRYVHEMLGTNARMTEIGAAIGRVQLTQLPGWLKQRSANAHFYDVALRDLVVTPAVQHDTTHSYHQYTVRANHRNRLIKALQEAGIGYGIYYDPPCHRQAPYIESNALVPNSDDVASEVLSIPVRPDLESEELDEIVATVTKGVAP